MFLKCKPFFFLQSKIQVIENPYKETIFNN